MSDASIGRFVWYELLTTDPKAAIPFYTDVVGWTTQPWESGEYTMWVGGQGPIGGSGTLPEEARKMGAPPFWIGNVAVADVNATAARAAKLGGKVLREPQDIPKVGRFAVIADREGAALQIFTAAGDPMKLHDLKKPGEVCWNELATTDHESAFAFYGELFGWQKISDFDMGPVGKYRIYGVGSDQLGGMFTKPKNVPMPPSWLYYFQVPDLAAAIERAKAKGAKVLNGPMEVPGGAHIVQMMDPQGAAFSLHEEPKAK